MSEVSVFRTRDWKSWLSARGVYTRHPPRHFSWFLYLKCYFWLIQGSALPRLRTLSSQSLNYNYFASNLARRASIFNGNGNDNGESHWRVSTRRWIVLTGVFVRGEANKLQKNQAAYMRYSGLGNFMWSRGWIRAQCREEQKTKVNSHCIFAVSYKIQIFRTKGS
jgi:hypothetical protein